MVVHSKGKLEKLADVPVCPLAKRAKFTQERDDSQKLDQGDEKLHVKSFQNVIAWLNYFPSEAMHTESHLRMRLEAKYFKSAAGKGATFDSVSTFFKLDWSWQATWIAEKTGYSVEVLKAEDEKDPLLIKHTFLFMINANVAAKCPSECIEERFCYFLCDARWAECGKRLASDVDENEPFITTRRVNWGKLAYSLIMDHGRAKQIVHNPTGHKATIGASITITAKFEWVDAWSESKAKLVNREEAGANFVCIDFFTEAHEGPHKHPELTCKCSALGSLKTNVNKKIDAIQKEASVGELDTSAFASDSSKKDSQKEASLQKAREALAARAAARAKTRWVTVG